MIIFPSQTCFCKVILYISSLGPPSFGFISLPFIHLSICNPCSRHLNTSFRLSLARHFSSYFSLDWEKMYWPVSQPSNYLDLGARRFIHAKPCFSFLILLPSLPLSSSLPPLSASCREILQWTWPARSPSWLPRLSRGALFLSSCPPLAHKFTSVPSQHCALFTGWKTNGQR